MSGVPTTRDSREADLEAIQQIYAFHVLHGLASFEEVPPSAEELGRRRQDVLRSNLPHLVAEFGGTIVGYS
jgi:phosphinothricin acetyltransferase